MNTMKYITGKNGKKYVIDFFCTIDKSKANANREGTTIVEIKAVDWSWYCEYKELSVYYRPERTWDDHMGNTPCGYFCIIPLPSGERKRVYMFS